MDAESDRNKQQELDDLQALRLRERDRLWEYRFVCLLLIVLIGFAGWYIVNTRINRSLRDKLQSILAAKFPNHLVSIDAAHLENGRGIVLEGLAISLREGTSSRVVVRVPRLIAQGNVSLLGLVQGQAPIHRVMVDAVDLSIWPLADGKISLQTLMSDDPLPPDLPIIDIRRGLLRIAHGSDSTDQAMICHDLTVRILQKNKATSGLADNILLTANLSSSNFEKLHLVVDLARDKSRWSMRGRVDELYYSSQWTDKLPEQWKTHLVQLAGFHGYLGAEFEVATTKGMAPRFLIHGKIRDGRLQHPNLPYPLQSLAGNIYVKNNMLQLREATATSGEARFELQADVHGLTVGSSMLALLKVQNLPLDARLYQALPKPIQEQWSKLRVAGSVDADLTLQFDGKAWNPEIVVRTSDGSAHPDIFPYPISGVRGEFHYRDGILLADNVIGTAGGQTVRGSLRLARASPKWLVDLTMASDGPVPIDETLIAALTPRDESPTGLQQFVRSLNAQGSVQLERSRFIRSADDIDNMERSIELSFHGGSIRYQAFRYPIFDIYGRVAVDGEDISLQRLRGRNDSAQIYCEGSVGCTQGGVAKLKLDFDSRNVPLEEELQAALPIGVRELWNHLRPSGVVDRVYATLEKQSPEEELQLAVRIQEDGKDDAAVGRSVNLRPQAMPYLLHNVACDVSYRPGFVQLDRFDASHDLSHIAAQGAFYVGSQGEWNGTLTWLPTTRLNVEQSLLLALPEYMRNPLTASEFRGPLAISGQTLVGSGNNGDDPSVHAWDLQIEIEDGQLAGGALAAGMRGSMHVLGENTSRGPTAKGYLALDSLAVKGIPVTQLTGPIAIADSKLLFGRSASSVEVSPLAARLAASRRQAPVIHASHNQEVGSPVVTASARVGRDSTTTIDASDLVVAQGLPPNVNIETPQLATHDGDLHAKTFDGTLKLYGVHPLLEGQTEVGLALLDARLAEFLADLGENHGNAEGRLWLEAELVGSLMHSNTLSGRGRAWLREASFYQMPVMTHLFRALSVRAPDDGAFESADVEFRIDGDRFPIDRISLDGDIIALRGNGWANLRRELHLDLYAYVGNKSALGAIFGPLVSRNDNATLLQLEVTGTTDQMKFRRAIPLIGSNLQQIFPERVASQNMEP
jgi:hypothetical protein